MPEQGGISKPAIDPQLTARQTVRVSGLGPVRVRQLKWAEMADRQFQSGRDLLSAADLSFSDRTDHFVVLRLSSPTTNEGVVDEYASLADYFLAQPVGHRVNLHVISAQYSVRVKERQKVL